ncbi:OmpA family protein [Photobacterium sp. BZF1]|uniref:OmpA family protein n=1 Tax=Photobacterium sp. BZF1 TaxID=1904457 RepID=UPI0016536F00|nr:OmpA family protein [Photobacterium sp. BZF1]MBC7006453.1 OmpA family protein [Photobacterium sp. BZF1]
MKRMLTGLLTLTLLGCSVTVDEPPTAEQSRDLRDFDRDGVINARDKCEGTPYRAVVDNDGCPTTVEQEEENDVRVLFANDSDVIPDTFKTEIKRMADFLEQYPETFIELKGYASPVGNAQHNVDLSQRRAKNVRQELINFGVDPNRIKTVGFGDSDPVVAVSEEATMTLSRRVIARVMGSQGKVVEEWTIFTIRDN